MKHLLITTIAAVVLVECGEAQPPEPPDSSIHAAALEGNIEAVKQHLASGADVNTKDSIGTTPLFLAVTKGQKEIVELLIAEGADVNAQRGDGKTPLDWAITYKQTENADLLRKHGGKSGAEFSNHIAAAFGNIEAVKQHLAAGADVNAKNVEGETPLDWAIGSDETETADLLRKHGGKTGEELKAATN